MSTAATNFIISTDLDGTLLDHESYSWRAAEPALKLCKAKGVPVILNTSKTLAEVCALQEEMQLDAPVIVENGSALVIQDNAPRDAALENEVIVFGVKRHHVLSFMQKMRASTGFKFESFNDWTVTQIAARTGLTIEAAKAASQKQYSEPFVWKDSNENLNKFQALANKQGLRLTKGGRFYHLQGKTNKAKPLTWLRENTQFLWPVLANAQAPELICLGDNANDIEMLNCADIAVCVRAYKSPYPQLLPGKKAVLTQGYGPAGWNTAILSILESNHNGAH